MGFEQITKPVLKSRDAAVPVLIRSKELKPVEPEPIRTDWNRNRNLSEQVEVGTRNKLTQCTEKSEK